LEYKFELEIKSARVVSAVAGNAVALLRRTLSPGNPFIFPESTQPEELLVFKLRR
jgi:hypothetical protein